MKNFKILFLLFFAWVGIMAACKKNKTGIEAELDKLPPITQKGANTFGCLVDGVAFIPNGRAPNGGPNVYAYIDPSFQGGRVSIEGFKYNSKPYVDLVAVGAFNCKSKGNYILNDSIPLNRIGLTRNITDGGLPCQYFSDIGNYRRGNFTIISMTLHQEFALEHLKQLYI